MALRWIEGCIGHKPVPPSVKQKRKMISNKRYHCIDCVIVMELEISRFCCFFLFLFWHFCYWVFSHGTKKNPTKAEAPFFADQPVHSVRAFDQSYLISPKAANFQGFFDRISDPKKNTESHVATKKQKPALQGASNLKKNTGRLTSWILI